MVHNPCFLICGVAAVQWRELEDQRFLCTPIRCSKSQRAVNQAVAIFVIVIAVVLNHLLHPPHPQTAAQSEASENCDFIFVISGRQQGNDLDTAQPLLPPVPPYSQALDGARPVSRAAVGRSETPRCHTSDEGVFTLPSLFPAPPRPPFLAPFFLS